MTEIYRVRSAWAGFPGGPGVSTMYFLDVATAVDSVHTFWESIKDRIPTDVHITVENSGDTIEDTTGDLTGAWSSEAVAIVDGSCAENYAAPVGAVVDWITETIAAGRRLRGRTFVVPMGGNQYQGDGSLSTACREDLQAAGTALVDAQDLSFVVYHRGTGSDGSNGLITSAFVPDLAAVLRSRRD